MKKEEILKNVEKWSVIFSENQSGFSVEDYREIKKAIIEKVIIPNKDDWEIKDILTSKGIYGNQTDTVLIHKLVKLEYDNVGILVEDLGKIHYKKGFIDEEWTEIKKILDGQETPPNPSKEQQDNYDNWTREQFITEINRLKAEVESLKSNQNLTDSEKQDKIQKSQMKLEQIQSFFNSKDTQQPTNNSSLTPLLIGGIVLAIIGLVSVLVIKKSKKVKKSR